MVSFCQNIVQPQNYVSVQLNHVVSCVTLIETLYGNILIVSPFKLLSIRIYILCNIAVVLKDFIVSCDEIGL